MSNSKGKSIFLIIIIVVILGFFFFRSPFFLAPFGMVSGVFKSVTNVINNGFCSLSGSFWGFPFSSLFSVLFFIAWIMVVVWVYRDAEDRRMNGLLWGLLVLIGSIIGLIIYLIIRNDYPAEEPEPELRSITCPHCEKPVNPNFAFCPSCGNSLKNICSSCSREVQDDWQVCPHCGERLKK